LKYDIVVLALIVFALGGSACEELPPAPEIPNIPPTATFFFNPVAPIYAGQTVVTFNAVGSRDTDGKIVSYVWNFGDGTPPQTLSQPSVDHTFPSTTMCMTRTYGVLLTVVDDRSGNGFSSSNVTVRELPLPSAPECAGR
jgi:PKD domain